MTEENLLTLDEIDRRHILYVVDMCGGNRTNAAQVLHIDRKTLYRKLLRWGVDKSGERPVPVATSRSPRDPGRSDRSCP
jgi:DNA-binding NtrC family response regulator